MFTTFLTVTALGTIAFVLFSLKKKTPKELPEKELAKLLAEVRYYKMMTAAAADGLDALAYSSEREKKIEELLSYIELRYISDNDAITAEIIKLDDYRARQSA